VTAHIRSRDNDAWRLQMLIDSVVDYAIYMIDLNGMIASWNAGAERIKGYKADDIMGRHFSCFYTDVDREARLPETALETASREGRFEAEGWRVRKDGTRFWASVVIDAIRDEAGELIGFAKVTRDITERMETQRILRETQEQLAASQRLEAIGQLSGGIAHDFNNLLMIILGNLESAERHVQPSGDAKILRCLANATRGAERAAALTQRLLAFSRRQPLNPVALDLNKYLPGVADFLQRSLGETIQIEVVGAPGLGRVEVDVPQLESTLVNLAINARDAMPGGGKLTLEVVNETIGLEELKSNPEAPPGRYVVIAMKDTGEGMKPGVMARAFEPFFTTKEIGRGTGLGLSQVYGFVKQSGGHVKIDSAVGRGTTIKMYFPHSTAETATADEKSAAPEAIDASETVLVVEDDPDLRSYLLESLHSLRYHAIGAPHAEEALRVLLQPTVQIHLMLADVVMPGMSGRELIKHARHIRPHMPVLLLSGYARSATIRQSRFDAEVRLIQKPVSIQDLALRIREALDKTPDPEA
jgi:PAS domain S-box-containing protein